MGQVEWKSNAIQSNVLLRTLYTVEQLRLKYPKIDNTALPGVTDLTRTAIRSRAEDETGYE